MLDTHAIARSLTDAKPTPEQADAITAAVRAAAEHGDHVTVDKPHAHAGLNAPEAPMYRAMLIQTAAIVGAVLAIPRLRA